MEVRDFLCRSLFKKCFRIVTLVSRYSSCLATVLAASERVCNKIKTKQKQPYTAIKVIDELFNVFLIN